MLERNLSTCKICQQVKVRILQGRFPNNSAYKYLDDDGKQWMGRTCPECHREKMANNYRKKNGTVKNNEEA